MNNLISKIDGVLNEEKRAYDANGRIRGGLGSFNVNLQGGWRTEGKIPEILYAQSMTDLIQSSNANLLIKLYGAINPTEKKQMQTYLIESLDKQSKYFDIAYLIIFVLYKTGSLVEGISKARANLKGDADHGFSNMLAMISKIIYFEYSYIDQNMYDKIKAAMQGETEHDFGLHEMINLAEVKLLERELSEVNPEINYDRDQILNIWATKFSTSEIPSLINEVEEYFYEGDFTNTKFATCIGRIRVLIVEISRHIVTKVAQTNHDSLDAATMDEHSLFDYLRKKKSISDDEWTLLKALYGMTSDNGAHALISPKEYARITKNMAYELILMLLSR